MRATNLPAAGRRGAAEAQGGVMDASLALKLAEALPALQETCPVNNDGAPGETAYASGKHGVLCPGCQGRGWDVPDLHIETVVGALAAKGYQVRSHFYPNGQCSHAVVPPYAAQSYRAGDISDSLELLEQAALDALALEAKHE